jgi:cytochrome P450
MKASNTGSAFTSRSRSDLAKDNPAPVRTRGSATAAHGDLLDLLLAARDPESGEALSEAEVRDQCSTMLVAGYEMTARLLFWATYLLTLDVAEQNRLRVELAAFPPERVRSLDDLLNWPRLRQTLLEALRLYPPAAYISREAIADDIVAGELIRPGTQVWISPWVMHRHRKFWDNPTAFMPALQASLGRGPASEHSYRLEPAHASVSGQHLPWPRPRSFWRHCCRTSKSRSMPHARFCLSPE